MKKRYSHSKLNTFEQCALKYKYRYIDRIKIPEKSIEALLGFVVHEVLEYLYQEIKTGRTPSIDELITIYSNIWQDNYDHKIKIVKKELTEKDYFNKGVGFIVNYYMQHKPFKDNTLECEKRIRIQLGENNEYEIIGFIDRLVYNLDNNEYEIHDYKTANNLPTQESVDNDRQLALYSIAIKDLFGKEKQVNLVWHYLAHNTKIQSKRTNQQLEELKKEIINLIKQIESATIFPSNKSILCNWCEYKSMCPAHTNYSLGNI